MILTYGKVHVVIVPKIKYAAFFEKKTYKYLYQMREDTYDRLLSRVLELARIFN